MTINAKAGDQAGQSAADETQLLQGYGLGSVRFAGGRGALYERHLKFDNVVEPELADARERFEAAARSVRDILSDRWLRTDETYARENPKRVYYLSIEFLIGRSLANNVIILMLDPVVAHTFDENGRQWIEILDEEPDAGLGNGGLGRLAACFLDSMATLKLPAMGYGMRYEHGIFRQKFRNGWQEERPDNWLRHPDPWEVVRPSESVEVTFGCSFEMRDGTLRIIPRQPSTLIGVPFDRPVIGYGGQNVNTLRLWSAAAAHSFDFQRFSGGDFVASIAEALNAESLTRVLYPDDHTLEGRGLRLMQEYFLVACSVADIVRRFRERNEDWETLPEKAAIQLNDTHPALAVPELMRILLMRRIWTGTTPGTSRSGRSPTPTIPCFRRRSTLAGEMTPSCRSASTRDYLRDQPPPCRPRPHPVSRRPRARRAREPRRGGEGEVHPHGEPGDRRLRQHEWRRRDPFRASAHDDGARPRRDFPRPLQQQDERRHAEALAQARQSTARGDDHRRDRRFLGDRSRTVTEASAARPRRRVSRRIPHGETGRQDAATDWLNAHLDVIVDPDTIFDCQIKRIHEYKRQLLNALRIVVLYQRLRDNPNLAVTPRTFIFVGKAAAAYHLAKMIIKFINNLARTLDADPAVRDKLRVAFLPEYNVSLAERIIPAADVSNQISTAGYEASGTSNMKFMMNGALTLGTRDGATIEMAEAAGKENFFLFGLTSDQVAESRAWYNPHWHYQNEPETRAALDLIFSDHFSPEEPGIFEPLRDALLTHGDYYMHLADLRAYLQADERVVELYRAPDEWARKSILNVASSGKFSSDRTIAEYASQIWRVAPCPVG